MKKHRMALVGHGRWGQVLAGAIDRSDDFRLAAICETDRSRWPKGRRVRRTDDLNSVWNDAEIDAVWIATPPATHAALVAEALGAGKHVLCEKPLAFTPDECRTLGRLADLGQRALLVDCTPVYLRAVQRARKEFDWLTVSRIVVRRISDHPPTHPTDARWDLLPHDLAVIQYWLGRLADSYLTLSDDGLHAQLRARSMPGPLIQMEAGYGRPAVRSIEIETPQGPFLIPQDQVEPEPLCAVLDHFADVIRRGIGPLTGATQAAETARLLAAFTRPKRLFHSAQPTPVG